MLQGEIELHCECARCGKSAWHTVRWLREHPAITCAGCGNAMASTEVLNFNSRLVRQSDDAERGLGARP